MKQMKILGLLAFAVLAVVALVGATSASASKFTASKVGAKGVETTLEKYVFTITGSSIECTTYNVLGQTEALETESVKGNVEISGCTAFGFAATFTNNGCEFTVRANGEGKMLGEKCELVMTVNNIFAKCKGNTKAQTIAKAASFANGAGDVVATANLTGIVAEVTESSGLCPMTVGKHTNATLTGKSTVQAEGATVAWDA